MHRQLAPWDAADFVLMALIDVDDPGLLILPTHRLLFGLSRDALSSLTSQLLAKYFTVQELGTRENSQETLLQRLAQAGAKRATFFIATPSQNWLLSLNDLGKGQKAGRVHYEDWKGLGMTG